VSWGKYANDQVMGKAENTSYLLNHVELSHEMEETQGASLPGYHHWQEKPLMMVRLCVCGGALDASVMISGNPAVLNRITFHF